MKLDGVRCNDVSNANKDSALHVGFSSWDI
jgi:hypothetical protein